MNSKFEEKHNELGITKEQVENYEVSVSIDDTECSIWIYGDKHVWKLTECEVNSLK